jgi:hypothetical protein
MSKILYTMSNRPYTRAVHDRQEIGASAVAVEEKRWWFYATVTLVVSAIYFAIILPPALAGPVERLPFQLPLLVASLAGALISVLGNVVLRVTSRIASGGQTVLRDERDRAIDRTGERVGTIVLATTMAIPYALALLRADPFWIAQGIYLALALWAFAGAAAKIWAYRAGV